MRRNLRGSTALSLFLSLSMPYAAFSQEAGGVCDPETDAGCAMEETSSEPQAEPSEETAPAEEVEVQTDGAETGDSTGAAEDAASTEVQPTDDGTVNAQEGATESSDAGSTEPSPEETTAGATEAEADDSVTERADGEGVGVDQATTTGTDATTDVTAETPETPDETLNIEEPETVLSEDTGLTEEAAAAEAAAAEEMTERAPVAATTEGETTSEVGAEPELEVTTVTVEDARSSEDEFSAAEGDDGGLSTLEKLLIVGVGAAALGELIDNSKIVQNTGDRVVLQRADGSLYVLRDDDMLLRRPGYEVATRTYTDGSTVSEITKSDGSVVRTIRDYRGRVLKRTRILPSGPEIVLFDDTSDFKPVVVEDLPLRRSSSLDYANSDAALEDALSAEVQADVGRRFSLSQIRNIRAVRELVPVIDLEAITFDTNSAAIRASEARKLDRLGHAMKSVTDERPWEVFLIEGHTDAVGSAVANLTLSDRRAESLALALNEYYDIPSENLVVQGYGERYLKVPVDSDERANRRVSVRRITPLLGMEIASRSPAVTGGAGTGDAPAEFAIFGNGYPSAGNPCSRSGESDYTSEYLDDSSDLVACPPNVDADQFIANLGGHKLSILDGWTLISVPRRNPPSAVGMPSVGSSTDLTEFEGARAGQAEMGIQALGFEAVRSEGLTTYWLNGETGACARIRTSDGRYSEVVMLPVGDC